jgi:oxygen-independent coproporphyrinogen-3 oxidase
MRGRYHFGVPGRTVGLYVHVPFCERVCPYCDFAVVAARSLPEAREGAYVDAVLAELRTRRGAFAGRELESLYLGGGTPSLLRPGSVARIIEGARSAFPGPPPREVTLEVNPSTLERERLPAFRDAGVGRVSIGIQSFDDRVLQRLGRAHRAEEGHRTLAASRAAGFEMISLDLIFAAPGQDLAGFERDLAAAIEFGPDHASVYELTIESGTPFARAEARGQLDRAGEEEAIAMIETAERRLAAVGLDRYEISSYARPGCEAIHNRRYWERRPVLGVGVGAFSTDPPTPEAPFGLRRANVRELPAYLAATAAGRSPEAAPAERLDAPTARGEAIFLGLRRGAGVDAARFEAEFGEPPRAFFGDQIEALRAARLLVEREGGDLQLTARGRLLSDTVFSHFV